jgi:pyrroloquinoline quinone (PQQ) biosynthesis protein C
MQAPREFEQSMARVIWERRWKSHTLFETFLLRHMSRPGAAVFALEHCVFAEHFPRWFGTIIGNCPAMDVRQYMIENMYLEEVQDPTIHTGHYESMVDFAAALGYDRAFVYGYEGRAYTKMALAYWERASRALPWLEAFATVAGLEAARGPSVAGLGNTVALKRKLWEPLGLPEKALEHWSAGEVADIPEGGHGDMTLKILAKHADSADKQARVLKCLDETMEIRAFHFNQIGRDAIEASGGPRNAAA